ncbi:hypothetical protein DMC63_37110 [Streptomyces sp. WAC 05977]|nr:hypothetical protein DMC63_37110 [Streptomyces sp. WAC 05977]
MFGVVLVDHSERRLQRVVDALTPAGWNGTDALRLYACDLNGSALLAKGLSRVTGVRVARPAGLLWLGADEVGPAVRVGGFTTDGRPLLEPADPGTPGSGWMWHHPPKALHPEGWIEPGTYDLPVPADAPVRLGLTRPEHLAQPGGLQGAAPAVPAEMGLPAVVDGPAGREAGPSSAPARRTDGQGDAAVSSSPVPVDSLGVPGGEANVAEPSRSMVPAAPPATAGEDTAAVAGGLSGAPAEAEVPPSGQPETQPSETEPMSFAAMAFLQPAIELAPLTLPRQPSPETQHGRQARGGEQRARDRGRRHGDPG